MSFNSYIHRFGPSLNGADARITRADKHLQEFKTQPVPLPFSNVQMRGQMNGQTIVGLTLNPVLDPVFSILVGEIVYNLRSALDYLIYELAFLDSGSEQEGTQFPIEDTVKGWEKHLTWARKPTSAKAGRPGYVQFLKVPHQTAICGLQPCSGVNWTAQLRDISNPDKHKRLSVTETRLQTNTAMVTTGSGVQMQSGVTPVIAFDDGTRVAQLLEHLKTQVTDVINSFKPEFQ